MKKVLAAVLISASLLGGCAHVRPTIPVERIPFPVDEYNQLNKVGTGVVSGEVFLKTKGGDVKIGAGNQVWLNPITTYSLQWYRAFMNKEHNIQLGQIDPRYLETYDQSMLYTHARSTGAFKFTNVPAGKYFIVSKLFWDIPYKYGSTVTTVKTGAMLVKVIEVIDGKHTEIMLTQ